MSHRSSSGGGDTSLPATESDDTVLKDLLGWGRLLSSLVSILEPLYQVDDLRQTDHPLRESEKPLGALVRVFGKGADGSAFLNWWTGRDGTLPSFDSESEIEGMLPLGLAYRWRASELQACAQRSFEKLDSEWSIRRDRVIHTGSSQEATFGKPLDSQDWTFLCRRLSPRESETRLAVSTPRLDEAIDRVRSFFAPLESPLFGMSNDLLAHHVLETIPREGPPETLTPIVPLFGRGHYQKAFPSTAQLPAHLRVILHRLVRSQDNEDFVTSLLATLEAVDFSLRFATGLGLGVLARLTESDFAGDFNPTTQEIIRDLETVIATLPAYWEEPVAQAGLNLLFQGRELHPFLAWGGVGTHQRLLGWMVEAEESIRQDNPARAAALLAEMMEDFNSWVSELTLLCSSWDLVIHVRQDGFLQIGLGRGEIWLSCKPLIDPTRYSVWLDRGELTLVNKGGALNGLKDPREPVAPLDPRICVLPGDPPFLAEQLTTLLRAHQQGEILPLGRSLFFGLEYLVRLHAGIVGGFLRHIYEEPTILDPVSKPSAPLEYVIYFLSYGQRHLGRVEQEEARLLRRVFYDEEDNPRDFSRWLGLDGRVPGPLQGLLGWSLSLMRPDAKTRLDEVRGQVESLSGLFADLLEESRKLWGTATLKTDPTSEGTEAVVLTFPSGLCLRGFPDLLVGPRLERGRRGVVVGDQGPAEHFSDWDGEEFSLKVSDDPPESAEEPVWPSFFDDSESDDMGWPEATMDAISRACQALSFAGPDARPRAIADEIAAVVTRQANESASVLFCKGGVGTGKTFLCRTLSNPSCTPLPDDYPVLYLKVDRFPRTRLATVVERLNDHLSSEHSVERFEWTSVPTESLKVLGNEVARLSDELSDLGLNSETLGNRLASYLRQLKKLNDDRSFLLILDGFGAVPASIIPSTLPPGVHLLITGTEFPPIEVAGNQYMVYGQWEIETPLGEATFGRQLQGLQIGDSELKKVRERFRGSLFLARVYRDLRSLDENYPASADILNDLFAEARAKFGEREGFTQFLQLLTVLGLYERPVPLSVLQNKIFDGAVVQRAIELFPSLFSFWDEPTPCLGLGHPSVLNWIKEHSSEVEETSEQLALWFLDQPRRGELLAALRWFDLSDNTASLVERFFLEDETRALWNEELSRLLDKRLFFQRVALLDAVAEPLSQAVSQGAGNLREELAWIYNARGLSLLELGLVSEARIDFEQASELFSLLFADGDLSVLEAMASAHSRCSEAALQSNDYPSAEANSLKALELLGERILTSELDEGLLELRSRVLLQYARGLLSIKDYEGVLTHLTSAIEDLEEVEPSRARPLQGECFLLAAQALSGQELDREAVSQLDTALDLLMTGATAELGLQALILRGRLLQKLSSHEEARRDLERALSLLRYHVAHGRLDLEPLVAYTAAQLSLVGGSEPAFDARDLTEYIQWARRRIRYEGRTDLRGLLAFLLLTRGARWKELGYFSKAASDLRSATEQYDLLSRDLEGENEEPIWGALSQSFRNLTALYLSLDEPHLALICGRRALELGLRGGDEESAEPEFELAQSELSPGSDEPLSEVSLYQLGKLYFHLGEAARRVGLNSDGADYFKRAARSFAKACQSFESVPEALMAEYSLVLKLAAQAAFEDRDQELLEEWLQEITELPASQMTDFDTYRYLRWGGQTAQDRGAYQDGQRYFEEALKLVTGLKDHPRWRSLEAEILLDLGNVLSLQGLHDEALRRLEQAAHKAHDALFSEGEESRDGLVLCALHSAVAHLRAGRVQAALEQLRILVSLRPGAETHEVEALAQDWVEAWEASDNPAGIELLKSLGQLSELGDWLVCTSLGKWYRDLVVTLIHDPKFETMIMSSSRIDRLLETYLILTFSAVERDMRPESNPELELLLAAKFRAFDAENRDLEAELLMGHLMPIDLNADSAKLLLRRSEMALLRGDRGLAIVDLLRAIDAGGECRTRAHLRLAEFLQSRGLQAAAAHHLWRALRATNPLTEDLSALCGRCCRLLTRLSKEGWRLDRSFYQEHFRVLSILDKDQLTPTLDLAWLRPAREQEEWTELLEMTLMVLSEWQRRGHDKSTDWAFLEEVLDRTVLCQGQLPLSVLERLGEFLTAALSAYDVQNRLRASALWERFAGFLPGLGKRNALELLQRLFEFALRTDPATREGQAEEFLRRLEEEKRILVQPR